MRKYNLSLLRKILWVSYLAISLVFIQGAGVHVHVYDHDVGGSEHALHEHHESAHLGYDASELGHPDEVAEIDLSQLGFLKNISSGSLVMALVMAVLIVLLPRLLTRVSWLDNRRVPLSQWPFSLRPPVRAPPL